VTHLEYVQQRVAQSGSSFYYAFLFLPPPQRAAITAFYAYCREIDDVVDDAIDMGVANTKLAWWRNEVRQAYTGSPTHPVMKAWMSWAKEYGIDEKQLQAVIEGCQMDLQQTRYLNFQTLQHYCHLVAGVVGEVSARIFGYTQQQTLQYAHQLGLALQLTNIIRDVGEDARRGRIYLPIADLQQFDVKAHEILQTKAPWGYSDRFKALMQYQAKRAYQYYDEAFALLPNSDRRAQRSGLMMAEIYRTLLQEIERSSFQVLHQRIALTPLRKVWIAMRTHWKAR
jgi:phytoene synthase